jgi:hypothetical protein
MPFLFRPLLHAQNYLWCRANPTMSISLFGLLNIPVPCEAKAKAFKQDEMLTDAHLQITLWLWSCLT